MINQLIATCIVLVLSVSAVKAACLNCIDSKTNCLNQVADFINNYRRRPLTIKVDGVNWSRNHYTRVASIVEDIEVEMTSLEDARIIARMVHPRSTTQQRKLRLLLKLRYRDGKKTASLSMIASKTANDLTNKMSSCDGPNCFNATLKWFYPELELEETNEHIIENYLRSHFKPIAKGEDIGLGDVVVYRDPRGAILHTAIYINEKYCWHKGGNTARYRWRFETHIGVNMMYGADTGARGQMSAYRFQPPSW